MPFTEDGQWVPPGGNYTYTLTEKDREDIEAYVDSILARQAEDQARVVAETKQITEQAMATRDTWTTAWWIAVAVVAAWLVVTIWPRRKQKIEADV